VDRKIIIDAVPIRPTLRVGPRYLRLVKAFPLCPLQSDTDLDEACAVVDGLLNKGRPLEADEGAYLNVLSDLIERYESEHHPMPTVSGAEMLRFLIDQHGVTLAQTTEATGIASSTLSSILRGRRELNLNHIRALARFFGVAEAAFVS
jgi:HTH-type transcriptional regulator / antitoxin HigA